MRFGNVNFFVDIFFYVIACLNIIVIHRFKMPETRSVKATSDDTKELDIVN